MECQREVEAWQVVRGLIEVYLGPGDRIINVQDFHSALVQALRAARQQGRMTVACLHAGKADQGPWQWQGVSGCPS